MREYTTETVGKLIESKREELGILRLIEQHKRLKEVWKTIPDPGLHRLKVEVLISENGELVFQCPSSVSLNYMRRQRPLLEKHLAKFMEEEKITSINFQLKG